MFLIYHISTAQSMQSMWARANSFCTFGREPARQLHDLRGLASFVWIGTRGSRRRARRHWRNGTLGPVCCCELSLTLYEVPTVPITSYPGVVGGTTYKHTKPGGDRGSAATNEETHGRSGKKQEESGIAGLRAARISGSSMVPVLDCVAISPRVSRLRSDLECRPTLWGTKI